MPDAVAGFPDRCERARDPATPAIEEVGSRDVAVTETVPRERQVDESSSLVAVGDCNLDGNVVHRNGVARAVTEPNHLVGGATAGTRRGDWRALADDRRWRVRQRFHRGSGGQHARRQHRDERNQHDGADDGRDAAGVASHTGGWSRLH